MLRLVAYSRDKSTIPELILNYSNYHESLDSFTTPSASEIKRYLIVATTIANAGKLSNNGILDHFTHVFMDEAGHSIESEAIGSMVLSTNPSLVIELAGDPKQLGPIIRSSVAKKCGLEKSLLERLSEMEPYARREESDIHGNYYDKRMITKLVHNYRLILQLYISQTVLSTMVSLLQMPRSQDPIALSTGSTFQRGAFQLYFM
eukprot:158503_1